MQININEIANLTHLHSVRFAMSNYILNMKTTKPTNKLQFNIQKRTMIETHSHRATSNHTKIYYIT